MGVSFFALIFLILCFYHISSGFQPRITIPEYTALGFQHINKDDFSANVYLGLPYAKAPIGDLRFEKPQILPVSSGKIINATSFPQSCHNIENMSHMGIESSEDCLYLNVITPSTLSKELLPVLVFIHGGGFSYGFTKMYGYEGYVDNVVSQNIIVVNLQYRLAHFGFLASDDFEIAGNFAHFDQIAAMEFLQRNIKSFGGDPKRITLSGHSAGSLSVHTLSLSPKARNLFSQEIHMGASNNAQYAINKNVFEHSKLISDAVGCGMSDTKERKACLKVVPHEKFWKVREELNLKKFNDDSYDFLYWTTVYDNDLFDGKTYEELLPQMSKNNILYGFDSGEGLLFSLITGHPITSVFSLHRGFTPEGRVTASAETIKEFLKQLFTNEIFTPDIQNSLFDEIFDFYHIGDEFKAQNPLHYFEKYTELMTDVLLISPTGKEIADKVDSGFKNQYMYIFNFTRPQDIHFMGSLPGHGYELLYFNYINAYAIQHDETFSDTEKLLQKQFSELFVTFVKTGKPSSAGISVPPITKTEIPYVEFNPEVNIEKRLFKERFDFWESLIQKYGYDFIAGKHLATNKNNKKEL